jgi:hypothetical protein
MHNVFTFALQIKTNTMTNSTESKTTKRKIIAPVRQIVSQFENGEITFYELSQQIKSAGAILERIYFSKQEKAK